MRTIAVAGHVCVDVRPHLGVGTALDPGKLIEVGSAAVTLGGVVGNTALDLTALGAPVRVFATVGDDVFGGIVAAELAADPLIEAEPSVVAGATTSYSLILEPPGIDRTIWHHVGANALFDAADLDLHGVDLLHLGYPPLLPAVLIDDGEPLVAALRAAKAQGVTTSVDLAVVDPLSPVAAHDWPRILTRMAEFTDVLSPSLDDLTSALRIDEPYSPELVDRLARHLLDQGAAVVAVSAGEHGLHLVTGSIERLRAAGAALAPHAAEWADRTMTVPTVVVDVPTTTNGAGDASSAGLLFGIATGADPATSALLAAACAAALVGGHRTTPDVVGRIRPDLTRLFPTADLQRT
jgi:sugar/nucleoside kinase (ribokinase family)